MAAAAAIMVAGSMISAVGQMQSSKGAQLAGQRKRAAADFEAAQMEQQAGQVVAASQRDAEEQRRQSQLMQSRALALAAASGAGASDPTVVDLIAKTAGDGAYRAGVALYQGEERHRQLLLGADAKRYEGFIAEEGGELEAQARRTMALGSIVQGGGSFYSKYGNNGPT